MLAGSGFGQFEEGQAITASFCSPSGIVVDSADNVYIADYANHRLRAVRALLLHKSPQISQG